MAALPLPLEEEEEDKASLESDFIDLLIASERVGTLIDRIKDSSCFRRWVPILELCNLFAAESAKCVTIHLPCRRRQAVFDLAAAVEKKESFVVEVSVGLLLAPVMLLLNPSAQHI